MSYSIRAARPGDERALFDLIRALSVYERLEHVVSGNAEQLGRDLFSPNAKIEALRNVGLQVIDIVKRRDAKELWDASDNLDQACEGCHIAYWYPGEKEYLKKLDKKLEDLYGIRADRSRKLGMDPK